MDSTHLVRVGAMGQVGSFVSGDGVHYPRRERVIIRTKRGLELGEVLAPPVELQEPTGADGSIVRAMTPQDQLLSERLEKNRHEAYQACVSMLEEKGHDAILIDVEHLFDGQGLFFYFLGEVAPELEQWTSELAETYETKVNFRTFTETLINGCGPDCGTENATGGCTDCVGCAVSGACGPSRS